MSYPLKIAIDGQAASGKSTLGELLAQKLDYTFLDSGKVYRAIARQVILKGITASDEEAVIFLLTHIAIRVERSSSFDTPHVIVGSENLLDQNLYTKEISQAVPIIAAYPEVRKIVREVQGQLASQGKVIIAGRDIGTVVMPDADLKIFLEVSLNERIERRYLTLSKKKPNITKEEIKADIIRRDQIDSHRHESPTTVPEDAVIINTDGKEPHQVVEYIITLMQPNSLKKESTKVYSGATQ